MTRKRDSKVDRVVPDTMLTQVTRSHLFNIVLIHPDGKNIVFVSVVYPNCEDDY
jgi:hypothetical protein